MRYKIVLSSLATKEIEKSYDWYEEQQIGLGNNFLEVIGKSLNTISLNPELFAKRNTRHREMVIKMFPFIIVYQIKKDNAVNILHIFHTKRNPTIKYKTQ